MSSRNSNVKIEELNSAWSKFRKELKKKKKIQIPKVNQKITWRQKKKFKKQFELSRKTASDIQREEIESVRKLREIKNKFGK